jgi:radical SAM protein with 4Fe4S-binding SPASM domain
MPDRPSDPGQPCAPSAAFAASLPAIQAARVRDPAFRASLAEWRSNFHHVLANPTLRYVIWMATRRCNLRCRYCVLPSEESPGADLSTDEVKRIFAEMAEDFDPASIMIGITGGEATLRPDLVDIVGHMVRLGFRTVAVDSNGVAYGRDLTLIDRLVEAGMRCPTISVDGTGPAQRVLRGDASAGAWTWRAIEYVQQRYPELGLTTICAASPLNLPEVPGVFQRFEDLGIRFARLSAIFPVGRAADAPEEVLTPGDLRRVLSWLAEQRVAFREGRRTIEIEFVDDGWCGLEWEGGLLRGSFLYCRAGLTVLGIEHDGRIVGCPVIHSGFNVQGDAGTQRVSEVWRDRFRPFRDRARLRRGPCASCREWAACMGGSMHDRDDDGNLARCMARTLRQGI